jgi:hypothetical protein
MPSSTATTPMARFLTSLRPKNDARSLVALGLVLAVLLAGLIVLPFIVSATERATGR